MLGTNNITSFVPRPASFECSVKNDSRIFKLYKDGKLIVNASLLSNNGTTSPSKYELRGPSANRFKINRSRKTLTFVLKETASEDFGFYSCKGIIGNRTVMQLEKYQLTVISKFFFKNINSCTVRTR